jgi:hypothetical protein
MSSSLPRSHGFYAIWRSKSRELREEWSESFYVVDELSRSGQTFQPL